MIMIVTDGDDAENDELMKMSSWLVCPRTCGLDLDLVLRTCGAGQFMTSLLLWYF